MQIRAKKTFKNLEDIFREGDVLTLNVKKYEEDTVICNALYGFKHPTFGIILIPSKQIVEHSKLKEGVWKFCDSVVAPKGSYKSSTITTADGRTYSTSIISQFIGYSHKMSDIFEKL